MARVIMPLCAERHYMGSTSNGRFSTDRSVRPDYDRRPDAQTRERWAAAHDAQLTRYLRDQNVVGLVLACQDARDDLAAATARLAEVQAALEAALAAESPAGELGSAADHKASPDAAPQIADVRKTEEASTAKRQPGTGTPRAALVARLTEAQAWLQARADEALANRRSASQRLRLIGISPKQEALIRAEAQRRAAERTTTAR